MKSRMLVFVLALAALLTLGLVACKKKEPAQGGGKAEPQAAKSGPIKMGAAAFFKEYSSLKGFASMKRYGNKKVQITGTIERTMDFGVHEGFQLWLATGTKAHISAKFADKGAAAKKKGFKKGASATVLCDIGGLMGSHIHLIGCKLL